MESDSPISECTQNSRYIEDDIELLEKEEEVIRQQKIPAGWETEARGLPWQAYCPEMESQE